MITIPENNTYIPEAHLSWTQEAFTNVLLDALEAYTGQVEGDIQDIWGMWEQEQHLLWEPVFDLVTAMGYRNVMLPYRRKEFAYERSLYQKARGVVSEAIRTKNLQLYISTRFQVEKQRQLDYLAQAKTYQKSVKYELDAQIKTNDAILKKFESKIEGEMIRLKQAIAIVERVERNIDLAVKLLTAQGEVLTATARNELEDKRATITLARAALEVKLANLEAENNKVKAEVIKAEVKKLQSQARVVQAETTVEEGRKYDIQADIMVIEAQAREIEVLLAELALVEKQTETAVSLAAEKQTAYDQILVEKTANVAELETIQADDIAANVEYAAKTKEVGTANNALALASDTAKLTEEELRQDVSIAEAIARMAELVDRSKVTTAEALSRLAELAGKAKLSVAETRAQLQQLLNRAKLDAAESKARLTATYDRARLNTAETKSKIADLNNRANLGLASHTANMADLSSRANLTAVESAVRMAEILDRTKVSVSNHEARVAELLSNLALALAREYVASERENAKYEIAALMQSLENYVKMIEADINVLQVTDKAAREAITLDIQKKDADAQRESTDILKDANVENTITEVRE